MTWSCPTSMQSSTVEHGIGWLYCHVEVDVVVTGGAASGDPPFVGGRVLPPHAISMPSTIAKQRIRAL